LLDVDKSLPGAMMAMARLNIPSVFVYAGSILPGSLNGEDLTIIKGFLKQLVKKQPGRNY
jgi:Dihydroxyacid dehydratase/phosphogluconate dehydratase